MSGLTDLEELTLRCRDRHARRYIAEAVDCYKIEAYRSCIVATWNAVVFDILHKLQELELTGDKNAQKILEDYRVIQQGGDARLKEALEFERRVLEVAADEFELVTNMEKQDLGRLQHDRNRCAHPSTQELSDPYEPFAELARYHLKNAVDLLLSREPVQGRAAFDRVCDEIRSEYFPVERDAAARHFAAGPLKRARTSLIRNVLVGVTKACLLETNSLQERKRQQAAVAAIILLHKHVARQVLDEDLAKVAARVPDGRLPVVLEYCVRIVEAWDALGHVNQQKLMRFVETVEDGAGADGKAAALAYALSITDLQPAARSRLSQLTDDQLAKAATLTKHPCLIPEALKRFEHAGSWRGAEALGENLILPLADSFTVGDVKIAVSAFSKNSEIWDAAKTPDVMSRMYTKTAHLIADTGPAWEEAIASIPVYNGIEYMEKRYALLLQLMRDNGLNPHFQAK